MRVTHTGTISVIRMPLHRDMKTEAQLKCRARFVKAQEMMLEALKDKKLMIYFQRKRHKQRYKTLRGCIRAYYIEQLIDEEQREAKAALAMQMRQKLSEVEHYSDNPLMLSEGAVHVDREAEGEQTSVEVNNAIVSDVEITSQDECDIGDG